MTYLGLKRYTNSWAAVAAVTVILTVVIAKLSWKYFEEPLVKFGHRERYLPASGDSAASTAISAPVSPDLDVLPGG